MRAELRDAHGEIGPLSQALGVRWLGVGFHPFARREDFEWVPKQRYGVMREYLPTRGAHALDMMLRTCTVQANLDYASEADAMRKMRVALALAPATTAMFANSPWIEGRAPRRLDLPRARLARRRSGPNRASCRRSGRRSARFDDYVEWALDVPMFLFKRGRHKIANTGQTFRSFWQSGFEGHRADDGGLEDAPQHALPRGAPQEDHRDPRRGRAVDGDDVRLPALWTGLLYDERALDEAESLVDGLDVRGGERAAIATRWRDGLRATFRGRPLAEVAERVVEIAEGGLERRARLDAAGRDERVHLARLRKLAGEAKTPADLLLEGIDREPDMARAILERASLKWE